MGDDYSWQTQGQAVDYPVHALGQRDDSAGDHFRQVGPNKWAESESVHDEQNGLNHQYSDGTNFQSIKYCQCKIANANRNCPQLKSPSSGHVLQDGVGEKAGN